jgi:2-polyprenyl-3-methyl-5-hydroxy-6-metoxy-1,4-benzoquinol methylase
MASVREHYDHHLGPVYGWMIGDFDVAKEAARTELRAAGQSAGAGRLAVDLGAGPGAHAIALAEAGYSVTAIDTCAALLSELRAHAGDLAITCVNDDVLHLRRHCAGALDVVVCMGDTLTHLPSLRAVEQLFEAISEALGPGGVFVTTFRDYGERALEGVGRFIPVRQDARRILTCFLEYEERTVTVYDLLHERTDAGWTLHVSSYSKLRLSPEWARSTLHRLGLVTTLETGPRGMVRLVATRPA